MKKLPAFLLILLIAFSNLAAQSKPVAKIIPKKSIQTKKIVTPPTQVSGVKSQTVEKTVVAKTPIILSELETAILTEINKARTNPVEYAKILEAYLKTFKGKDSTTPDGVELTTNEGTVPVLEAITALKQTSGLTEFKVVEGLNKAAKDHALDLVTNNKSGHTGSNGSLPMQRVEKYGIVSQINENISYFTKTARAVVMTMLIDDGTASRNHRKNLLSSTHKVIGIATGENKAVGNFCVILFTDKFTEGKGIRSF